MSMIEHELLDAAAAARAVNPRGWRMLLGGAYTSVAVSSWTVASQVASQAIAACGTSSDHLRLDLRPDCVDLVLRTPDGSGQLSRLDAEATGRISAAIAALGLTTVPTGPGVARPVQALEICIDALDIPAVLPFWQAVFGYVKLARPIAGGVEAIVVDPAGQGPTVWFQQLDAARTQRNRIHFDLTVAEDEADARIAAAVDAGGHVVNDAAARAFWILADPEGNEVCICTWQDRD